MKKTEEGSPRKGGPEQDEVGISGRRASEPGHRPLHHQEPIPTAAFKKEHATEVLDAQTRGEPAFARAQGVGGRGRVHPKASREGIDTKDVDLGEGAPRGQGFPPEPHPNARSGRPAAQGDGLRRQGPPPAQIGEDRAGTEASSRDPVDCKEPPLRRRPRPPRYPRSHGKPPTSTRRRRPPPRPRHRSEPPPRERHSPPSEEEAPNPRRHGHQGHAPAPSAPLVAA
nr:basic salivary proline-rich protein 4-like [Aegilops tauschii subsp. strangulata]